MLYVQYVVQKLKRGDKVNRLKDIRKQVGLTQKELSQKAKVSRSIISAMENQEEVTSNIGTLKRIADVLNKKVSEIFDV